MVRMHKRDGSNPIRDFLLLRILSPPSQINIEITIIKNVLYVLVFLFFTLKNGPIPGNGEFIAITKVFCHSVSLYRNLSL